MKTINRILERHKLTLIDISNYDTNGCGAKDGLNFSEKLEKFKGFIEEKRANLVGDLRTVCNLHDIAFEKGKTICDFLNANYTLACDVLELLHWTSTFRRLGTFILIFGGTTLFGWKAFKNK